jgi:hypothetical protein
VAQEESLADFGKGEKKRACRATSVPELLPVPALLRNHRSLPLVNGVQQTQLVLSDDKIIETMLTVHVPDSGEGEHEACTEDIL